MNAFEVREYGYYLDMLTDSMLLREISDCKRLKMKSKLVLAKAEAAIRRIKVIEVSATIPNPVDSIKVTIDLPKEDKKDNL